MTLIENKVFGVGMKKTGTCSLESCYEILDISPVAPSKTKVEGLKKIKNDLKNTVDTSRADYSAALDFAERYRSFEDSPWNIWEMYQKLDQRFPDSKFILTCRDSEKWWRSVERWATVTNPGLEDSYRRHIRAEEFERDAMIAAYENYNNSVIRYFEGTDKLLVIDFEAGEGWGPICDFLNVDIPSTPFPHANQQSYDEGDLLKGKRLKKRRKKQKMAEGRLSMEKRARNLVARILRMKAR
jgi:hypothetical protein